VDLAERGDALRLGAEVQHVAPPAVRPVVLAVDDSPPFAAWLEQVLAGAGVTPLVATDAAAARDLAARRHVDLAVVDLLTSEGDGLWLAFELIRSQPRLQVIVMTGPQLSTDEAALCRRQDFPVLRKPFLAQDLVGLIRARLLHSAAVGG